MNKNISKFIFTAALFVAIVPAQAQKEKVEHTYYYSKEQSYAQAEKKALEEAKEKALQQAGVSENIEAQSMLFRTEVNDDFNLNASALETIYRVMFTNRLNKGIMIMIITKALPFISIALYQITIYY